MERDLLSGTSLLFSDADAVDVDVGLRGMDVCFLAFFEELVSLAKLTAIRGCGALSIDAIVSPLILFLLCSDLQVEVSIGGVSV